MKQRRMLRPKVRVLSPAALVPPHHVIKPPPNQFTHELQRSQPYFYDDAGKTPTGEFPAGTHVVLLVYDGGATCRVVDGRGLYVETSYTGLHRL
jgi:hypothetical protein